MSQADNAEQPVQQDENHIIAERRAKLAEWRKTGKAFPNDFQREKDLVRAHHEAVAGAAPEQLYLPRRCVEFLEFPWSPEQSLALMKPSLDLAATPAPRPAGPTRNGPCPCGSGKKYKQCHGKLA